MGSCCCTEKPKKEEEKTRAQIPEDKTQATERQDVQQSAEQQQKISDEAVVQHEHPSKEKGTSSEEKPKKIEDEKLLVPNQSNEMKKQPPEVKSAETFKSKEVELEMKKGGAVHAGKKKSAAAKGNKDHKENSASDPIDYWLTAEERIKVASGEPILPVDKTMEVVLSVVQPPPVDYSALPPGLKPSALQASKEKTQVPESPKPGTVQKPSAENANKLDGAADLQRRPSSKEMKRSTQGPLRSGEKVSTKMPVVEGAYGVADRPLTPPSAPHAYGVADRPMGFRSAERTSTHKRPVTEGAYGVADRPKSLAPAVQAYGVADRPVAQPSAKKMHGGFFNVDRQQQPAQALANRGMAAGTPRASPP